MAFACKAPFATDALERFASSSPPPSYSAYHFPHPQHGIHRFSAQNNADPGLIPGDLRPILDGLTQMEEMLCSLASPCFLMWISKGGQYKSRGNVITFPQDLSLLCTTLPRLPQDLDVILIRKPDAKDPVAYKDFRVRKQKVLDFLYYLREHNPYYADIVIRPAADVNLPDDDSILPLLPNAPPRHPSEDGVTAVSIDEQSVLPEELSEEQNSFVPSVGPATSEQDAISTNMRSTGLALPDSQPLSWPLMGPALSEYTTKGLFSMAFPSLFPLGSPDITDRRPRKIDLHEWVKHLMRYRDSRFAIHPRFRFFTLNLIFRHRAMQRGKFLFSRNISHHNMTVGQLKNALAQHDGPRLAADIARCLKTVKATRPFWQMEGGKLRDMIAQIGTPTFFYTLSMADMSWPDLHKLMPDDPLRPGLTTSEAAQIRQRNIANNPHIVAAYLTTKHTALKDTVLQHLDLDDTAHVSDFWYRVEWQARGSGLLFIHSSVSFAHSCQVTFMASCGSKTPSLSTTLTGHARLIVADSSNTLAVSFLLTTQTLSQPGAATTACSATCCCPPNALTGTPLPITPLCATAVKNMVQSSMAIGSACLHSVTRTERAVSTFLLPLR